jgi:hypothetical protein
MKDDPKPRITGLLPIDERPGRLPQITFDGQSIAYSLVVRRTRERIRLVLRCDAAGAVWASVHPCD